MTPQTIIQRLDAAIAGYGQSVTLQRKEPDRVTGVLTVTQSVDCPAAVRSFGPQDLESGEVVDIRVVVSGTGLGAFGLPRRDDVIILHADPNVTDPNADSRIVQIAPLYYGGTLCRVNMLCRG